MEWFPFFFLAAFRFLAPDGMLCDYGIEGILVPPPLQQIRFRLSAKPSVDSRSLSLSNFSLTKVWNVCMCVDFKRMVQSRVGQRKYCLATDWWWHRGLLRFRFFIFIIYYHLVLLFITYYCYYYYYIYILQKMIHFLF